MLFLVFVEILKNWEVGFVKFYYCVCECDDIFYVIELDVVVEVVGNLEVIIVNLVEGVWLIVEWIVFDFGGEVFIVYVFFCGLVVMCKVLRFGLILKGLNVLKFYFEEFEMWIGIGFGMLVIWFWNCSVYELEKW